MHNKEFDINLLMKYLKKSEQKISSQSCEDGVLLALLDLVGSKNKFCVEFGATGAFGDNTLNLVKSYGYEPLWMGTSANKAVKNEFVTAENVSDLFEKYKVPDVFDVLSIDIDGNDLWVWKAIDKKFKPSIVVIEFNCHFSPEESYTIKYQPEHRYRQTKYYGASLLSLKKTGAALGYSLVYTTGPLNAFFVRNELLNDNLHNIPIETVFSYPVNVPEFYAQWGLKTMPTWYESPAPDISREQWEEII